MKDDGLKDWTVIGLYDGQKVADLVESTNPYDAADYVAISRGKESYEIAGVIEGHHLVY